MPVAPVPIRRIVISVSIGKAGHIPRAANRKSGNLLLAREMIEKTLAEMAVALEQSPDYRIMRRLVPRVEYAVPDGRATKIGLLLDVETTGLDPARDEIIELGMVKFEYVPDGRITRVTDTFSCFNEPSGRIPEEITNLTGITDELVRGHKLDEHFVQEFASDSVVVIAHNAAFDRKFVERYCDAFQNKFWACSASEIEWRNHGFQGSRLSYLLMGAGFFHQPHRAVDDCRALLEILAMPLPGTGTIALAALLERARRKTVRIWAEQSPFELKDELKRRGYRWSDGSDGRPKSWYIEVEERLQAEEIEFLRKTIYLRDVDPSVQILSARDRFSVRV